MLFKSIIITIADECSVSLLQPTVLCKQTKKVCINSINESSCMMYEREIVNSQFQIEHYMLLKTFSYDLICSLLFRFNPL